jgi:hypothetical protein
MSGTVNNRTDQIVFNNDDGILEIYTQRCTFFIIPALYVNVHLTKMLCKIWHLVPHMCHKFNVNIKKCSAMK